MTAWTRLYLVRHGEVAAEWRQRVYGDLDVPLSTAGEEEARAVARLFAGQALAEVVSSGLARAEFTAARIRAGARAAADGGVLSRRDDERLRELGRGEWAGLEVLELARRFPEAWRRFEASGWTEAPPGGETLAELATRVLPALDEVATRARAPVAIVAHKWVLRVAICEALGCPLERCANIEVATSGLLAFDWPRERALSTRPTQGPQLLGLGLARLPEA